MMVCGHPYARRILTEEGSGLWLTVDVCPDCGQLVAERGSFEHIEFKAEVEGLTVEKIQAAFDASHGAEVRTGGKKEKKQPAPVADPADAGVDGQQEAQ